MKRVIITGASGPLGIVLIQECIQQNIEVLAITRPNSKNIGNIPQSSLVKILQCDISEISRLPELAEGEYDTCYHLAWTHTGDAGRNDPLLQEENIKYTLQVAECAKKLGCNTFIGAGSQAEYGLLEAKADENTPTRPVTLYGITKLAAGQLVMAYCQNHGMRCNWIRIFAVYGPYENDYIFTSYVIQTLLKGEKPELTPCEQIWDYLYCKDAAKALYLVGEKVETSGIYCLGSGEPHTIKEYIEMIRDAIAPELLIGIGMRDYGVNQIMHLEADISKLQHDTGFEPAYSFEDGMKQTIAWYRQKF